MQIGRNRYIVLSKRVSPLNTRILQMAIYQPRGYAASTSPEKIAADLYPSLQSNDDGDEDDNETRAAAPLQYVPRGHAAAGPSVDQCSGCADNYPSLASSEPEASTPDPLQYVPRGHARAIGGPVANDAPAFPAEHYPSLETTAATPRASEDDREQRHEAGAEVTTIRLRFFGRRLAISGLRFVLRQGYRGPRPSRQ